MKLVFCTQISMKACYKLMVWFWWGWPSIPKVTKIANLQCLYNKYCIKEVKDEVYFLYADKHQSFLKVYFNTLGIKVSCKFDIVIINGMIKHSEITESNKLVISLQYLKKEFRNRSHFWHADKCRRVYKLVLSFLWKWPDIFEILRIGSWQYFCNVLRKIVATAFLVLLRGKFLRNFYSFCELWQKLVALTMIEILP